MNQWRLNENHMSKGLVVVAISLRSLSSIRPMDPCHIFREANTTPRNLAWRHGQIKCCGCNDPQGWCWSLCKICDVTYVEFWRLSCDHIKKADTFRTTELGNWSPSRCSEHLQQMVILTLGLTSFINPLLLWLWIGAPPVCVPVSSRFKTLSKPGKFGRFWRTNDIGSALVSPSRQAFRLTSSS